MFSDILTELDGIPSQPILNQDVHTHITVIDKHFWLRNHQNKVLRLYTTDMAYAQPHDVGDLIRALSTELDSWYRSLPFEDQFVRDITTLRMAGTRAITPVLVGSTSAFSLRTAADLPTPERTRKAVLVLRFPVASACAIFLPPQGHGVRCPAA
jgi:hypothetical protein